MLVIINRLIDLLNRWIRMAYVMSCVSVTAECIIFMSHLSELMSLSYESDCPGISMVI